MAKGIYKITNKVNGKFYIGSSIHLVRRKAEHKYRLKNYRGNSIIRNAVLKYGEDAFNFEILEEIHIGDWADKAYISEIITTREQYYVDSLNPEYNIKKEDVTTFRGVEITEKQRLHLLNLAELPKSEKQKEWAKSMGGLRRGKKNIKCRVKVDVYHKDTLEFIETITGIRECGMKYNIDSSYLSKLCKDGYTNLPKSPFVFTYHGNCIKLGNHDKI